MNILMLAEVPQMKNEHFSACGSSANGKKKFLAFAEVPQMKNQLFGACGSPANGKK
ncbi:hypothetical protein T229_01775 [Tannerella sp. oral taxon BU063 isolate Cell 5]|uniref:Uncharacterized protein n=1 Tax=Tannerella sp. oral taxon BU063 isolate Cell 5 TaxID=1410950 RepID=W2CGQ2_9BACT|nr:hypothetical protein T229_01775 [Tannerella sp. oral taxon BU063 isolate Cell 5]